MRRLLQILSLSLSLSLLAPAITPAQLEVFGADMAVYDVVDNIRDTAHGVIAALDTAVGNNLFRTRQHLELLVNQVETVTDDAIERTFGELAVAQRTFLTDVKRQLDELTRAGQDVTTGVRDISTYVATAVVNLPMAGSRPLVFNYSPLYVQSSTGERGAGTVNITVSGVLLASHDPTLVLGSQRCVRATRIDTRLVFQCNVNTFVATESVESISGKLYVYERLGFLGGFFSDPTEYDYDILVNVVPLSMATATPSVTTQSTSAEREARSQDFSHRNGHCQGTVSPLFPFNARGGWKIDPASISASCNNSSKSTCNGIQNVTDLSFGYSCTVANNGSCGPFWRDGRGACWGSVSWQEVRDTEVLHDEELAEVKIDWGQEIIIDLPEGVQSVRIVVDKVDGTRRIITGSEADDPWFDAEVDLENGQVIIRPELLQVAMDRRMGL